MVRQLAKSQYDVIVVGAGNAALTAALSARQQGARVLVLEKAPEAERGGNSRFSGGIFRFAYDGIEDLKPLRPDLPNSQWDLVDVGTYGDDRYLADLMRVTEGQANAELSQTLIRQSYPTMLWMTDLGVSWEWSIVWSTRSGERVRFNPGAVLQARNKGVGLVEDLFESSQRAGVDVAYQAKMTGFLQDNAGRVTGVRVKTTQGIEDASPGAVVLASGGFEANPEMRARYLGTGWDQVKVRGTRFNTGETLRMALDIGAMPVGHWQGCHATPIDANASPEPGLLVEGLGERYHLLDMMVKAYACHASFHPVIDGIHRFRFEVPYDPARIQEIKVVATERMIHRHGDREPSSLLGAQYSLPFSTAVALCRDIGDPSVYNEATLWDGRIRELSAGMDLESLSQ